MAQSNKSDAPNADASTKPRTLDEISRMGRTELQRLHLEVFGRSTTTCNVMHLRGMIARELLARAGQLAAVQTTAPSAPLEGVVEQPRDGRLPRAGSVLRREHGGVVHRVKVLDEGFVYQGAHYRSLSVVARTITGHDVERLRVVRPLRARAEEAEGRMNESVSKQQGQLRWWGRRYSVRVRFADGSRRWGPLPEGLSHTEALARANEIANAARGRSAPEDTKSIAVPSESLEAWSERWTGVRERTGYRTVSDDRSRVKRHILPVLGAKPMGAISTDDIETLRDSLDRKIQGGEIAWTTGQAIWSAVKTMFKAARLSKHRELRVRRDDPTLGVATPHRGATKAKQFLFPTEFLQLVSCEAVPMMWRRAFTLATYLMLRASELEALGWDDLDLEHGTALIHRSVVRTNRTQDGETKSEKARRLAIEPNLVPLLAAMNKETGGRKVGRVLHPMPPWYDLAKGLRVYLLIAGVERPELHARGPTRRWITFHDLRATGITWAAVRGDDPLKIRQRVGHEHLMTTERYIRVAEEVRTGFGEPFPSLPHALIE